MMTLEFKPDNLDTLSDALDIAEDATINFFKFSSAQWQRHRYEVETISSRGLREPHEWAFAVLHRGFRPEESVLAPSSRRDHYFICLQDHRILEAVSRDGRLGLLPLLIYVLAHELVHIVRFASFRQRFMAGWQGRAREEMVVHDTTHRILKGLSVPALDHVLNSYGRYFLRADGAGVGPETEYKNIGGDFSHAHL